MASIDPQLADMLNQTVTWYARASTRGTYGDPTWGVGTSITARVVFTESIVRTATGEDAASTARTLTASAVDVGDRLLLPSETVAREVLAVSKATDEDGTIVYRVAYC